MTITNGPSLPLACPTVLTVAHSYSPIRSNVATDFAHGGAGLPVRACTGATANAAKTTIPGPVHLRIGVEETMKNNTQAAAKWDWLAEPDAALDLYSAERRAFYDWQVVEQEWSAATSRLASCGRNKPLRDRDESLERLKNRLDEAAQAYEQARQRLYEAWSA